MNKTIIRTLVAALAIVGCGVTTVDAAVKQAPTETPAIGSPEQLRPMANCPGADVYVVYNQSLGCTINPPQRLHEVYIPSAWTLAQAHTHCADHGSPGAYTRFNGYANVCPNIDY